MVQEHSIPIGKPPAAATPPIRSTASGGANTGLLGAIGITIGLGAIAASSCCVVPLAFAALGAGVSVFGTLEVLVSWRLPILVASSAWVSVAWLAWWRSRRAGCDVEASCAKPSRSWASISLLLLATVIVAVAVGWNYLELPLLRLIRSA